MRYDTTALLAQIKRIPEIPSSQALFSDEDLLAHANDALELYVTPLVQSVQEGYFLYTQDYTVSVAESQIELPTEASGLRFNSLFYVQQPGGNILIQAPRVQVEQLGQQFGWGWVGNGGGIYGGAAFYVQNNLIKFYPQLASETYCRLYYFRICNALVPVASGTTVVSTDSDEDGNTITVASAPAAWETDLGANFLFDVISPDMPYSTRGTVTVNGISGNVLYINDPDEYALIQPGDYFYYRGEAPVLQYVPQECFTLLAYAAAAAALNSLGDSNGFATTTKMKDQFAAGLMKIISPRVPGHPKKIVNRNNVFRRAGMGMGDGTF